MHQPELSNVLYNCPVRLDVQTYVCSSIYPNILPNTAITTDPPPHHPRGEGGGGPVGAGGGWGNWGAGKDIGLYR
jgi:hypothetical protein